jgi:hypothetical protein
MASGVFFSWAPQLFVSTHALLSTWSVNSSIVCSLRSAVCTQKHVTIADSEAMETTREKATYENHDRRMGW